MLKREKRKFEIGFVSERNTNHDIQVIFNGIQIKGSPFIITHDTLVTQLLDNLSEITVPQGTNTTQGGVSTSGNNLIALDDYMIVEGGPIDGLQCGEKMWIILDAQTAPYNDIEFKVVDPQIIPIKHSKIQQEDGRWKIEFIPVSIGLHKIYQIIDKQTHLIHKCNVLSSNAQRFVYGYKLYNVEDSLQLVFDAGIYKSSNIIAEVKGPNDKLVTDIDCKYLPEYLAIKFIPKTTGSYLISFYERNKKNHIASSPYKIIVHEDYKEILKCMGIYDLTRLRVLASLLPANYDLKKIKISIKDPNDDLIKNFTFTNDNYDLVIEFVSRVEGLHRVYVYVNNTHLINEKPFQIYIHADEYLTVSPQSRMISKTSLLSSSSSSSNKIDCGATLINYDSIRCIKTHHTYTYVINNDQDQIQGLCVYDPFNEIVQFKINKDLYGNASVSFVPTQQGTYKIVGLIDSREFEAQLFVLDRPSFETLFELQKYPANTNKNLVGLPYSITLHETNLEVDVFDSLGERVDVRYTTENSATFIPRISGFYKLYLSDYHGPIIGCPFYVQFEDKPQASVNDLPNIESSGIRDTIVNEETKFLIRNKDIDIDVQIKDPNKSLLNYTKKRNELGYLEIYYTPKIIGLHEVHILKANKYVLGSPVVVYVFDPNNVKITKFSEVSFVNRPFSFTINALEAGEGFIRVNIKDPEQNDILPEIIEYEDRNYEVTFNANLIGSYEFSLTFNKYHIRGSPFKANIIDKNDSFELDNDDKHYQQYKGATSRLEDYFLDSNKKADYEVMQVNNANDTSKRYKLNNDYRQGMLSKGKDISAISNPRTLTPITDTSEETSDDERVVYRGETFIEKFEKMPDGSAHLLLHIDDLECIDLNTIKGKYKYKLKRVGGLNLDSLKCQIKTPTNSNAQEKSKIADVIKKFDSGEASTLTKENPLTIDEIKPLKQQQQQQQIDSPTNASVSEKRNFFENAANAKNTSPTVTSKKQSTKNDKITSDSSEDEIINVSNENTVTKMTKKVQKSIDEERTIIKDEKYEIIETEKEENSKLTSKKQIIDQVKEILDFADEKTTITKETSGINQTKTKETITQSKHSDKQTQQEQSFEKFKPEETITYLYEYEQVVESDGMSNKTNKTLNRVDHTSSRTTKTQDVKIVETIEPVTPKREKKTTTSTTTYIKQEEKDKVIESIEKTTDVDSFSYQQSKLKDTDDNCIEMDNTSDLSEYYIESSEFMVEVPVTTTTTTTINDSLNFSQTETFSKNEETSPQAPKKTLVPSKTQEIRAKLEALQNNSQETPPFPLTSNMTTSDIQDSDINDDKTKNQSISSIKSKILSFENIDESKKSPVKQSNPEIPKQVSKINKSIFQNESLDEQSQQNSSSLSPSKQVKVNQSKVPDLKEIGVDIASLKNKLKKVINENTPNESSVVKKTEPNPYEGVLKNRQLQLTSSKLDTEEIKNDEESSIINSQDDIHKEPIVDSSLKLLQGSIKTKIQNFEQHPTNNKVTSKTTSQTTTLNPKIKIQNNSSSDITIDINKTTISSTTGEDVSLITDSTTSALVQSPEISSPKSQLKKLNKNIIDLKEIGVDIISLKNKFQQQQQQQQNTFLNKETEVENTNESSSQQQTKDYFLPSYDNSNLEKIDSVFMSDNDDNVNKTHDSSADNIEEYYQLNKLNNQIASQNVNIDINFLNLNPQQEIEEEEEEDEEESYDDFLKIIRNTHSQFSNYTDNDSDNDEDDLKITRKSTTTPTTTETTSDLISLFKDGLRMSRKLDKESKSISVVSYALYSPSGKKNKKSALFMDLSNISFLVNVQKAGPGNLRIHAQHEDGMCIQIIKKKINTYIYTFKINAIKIGILKMFLEHNSQSILGK